jgi:hypothetical protein
MLRGYDMGKGVVATLMVLALAAGGLGGVEVSKRFSMPEQRAVEMRLEKRTRAIEKRLREKHRQEYQQKLAELEGRHRTRAAKQAEHYARLNAQVKSKRDSLDKQIVDNEAKAHELRSRFFGTIDDIVAIPGKTDLTVRERQLATQIALIEHGILYGSEFKHTTNVIYDKTIRNTNIIAGTHEQGDRYLIVMKKDSKGGIRAVYAFGCDKASKSAEQYVNSAKPYMTFKFGAGRNIMIVNHAKKSVRHHKDGKLVFNGPAGFSAYDAHAKKTLDQFKKLYARGMQDGAGKAEMGIGMR